MAQNHNVSCIEHPMTVATTEQGPQKRYRRLRFPSFNSDVWSEKNPLLQKGELGHEKDTGRFKVGDGVTYWEDLPYNSVGDKGDKGDNATINGYNTINIVEGRNIIVEQEGDTLIISAKGEASGSYNKEEIDNKFAVVNSSIDANADAIQKTRNDYIEADSEIHQILNSHAGELTTLKNNQDDLGDQVSGIEEKIPETASGTNHLITKQQLLDVEMDIREEISAVDSSAVHKTGNETIAGTKTFTSNIVYQRDIDQSVLPSSNQYIMWSSVKDKNYDLVSYIETSQYTTGDVAQAFGARRKDSNGTNQTAVITVKVNADFTKSFRLSESPASTSNGTDIATTAWANAKFLPLAGGTLSGVITRSGTHFAKRNVDNSYLEIDGGTNYLNGAYLRLDGKDNGDYSGRFTIATGDGSKNIALIGKTDGTLMWNGKTVLASSTVSSTELGYLDGVTSAIQTQLNGKAPTASPAFTGTPTAPTAASSTNSTQIATTAFVKSVLSSSGNGLATFSKAANGYYKFNNGLIIQWGLTEQKDGVIVVTFPVPFTGQYTYAVTATLDGKSSSAASVQARTNTTFSVDPATGHSSANKRAAWIAIGY